MELKSIKNALPSLLKADITALLVGNHGSGKTETIKQFAKENDFFLKIVNLGTMGDSGDLLGLPTFTKDSLGNNVATSFITPDWVKEIIDYANKNPQSKAIIYLDEINRARRDILQAVFSLVLEKRIHMTQFPSNVGIIAAMNPNTGDYVVTDISDKAFLDRFLHIKVTPSVEEWLSYAKQTKHDDSIVSFLGTQKELLDSAAEDINLDEIKPSRRSWSAVDRLLKANPPQELIRELMFGLVGTAATIAYEEHVKSVERPLNAEDILVRFNQNLSKIKTYITENKIDLLEKTGNDINSYLQHHQGLIDDQKFSNLESFIETVPAELSFLFCQTVIKHPSVFDLMIKSKRIEHRLTVIKGVKNDQ